MNLMPLMDRRGNVTAWADRNSGWVSDQMGKVFALVWFDGVFNQRGAQIGGWCGDHIRDRYGRVVLVRPGTKIENVNVPRSKKDFTTPDVAFAIESSSAEMVADASLEKIPMGGG